MFVRYEVLTVVLLKVGVFWDMTLCCSVCARVQGGVPDIVKDYSAFIFGAMQCDLQNVRKH